MGFANNIGERRAEVERLFGGKGIVQEARYTHLQLQGFKNAVERDVEWFETVGVEVMWIDIDEMANVVTVQYRAPNQGAEPQILEHFEAGNWLRLDWAGPPPWTGPLGDMEVALVDSEGRPVGFVLTLNSRDPRVHGWGPYQVPEGSWHNVGIEAVDWLIEITYVRDGQETTITRELTVAPDAPAKLTVVIDE